MRITALLFSASLALSASACMTLPPAAEAPPSMPIVGGFAPASGNEPGYKSAEALAIDTIYKREPQRSLVEARSAQVQVVAGLNFRFDVKMSGQNRYRVTIFRDLQGNLTVSDFTKTGGG